MLALIGVTVGEVGHSSHVSGRTDPIAYPMFIEMIVCVLVKIVMGQPSCAILYSLMMDLSTLVRELAVSWS